MAPEPDRVACGSRRGWWRRHRALARALERRMRRGWLVRTGRVTAWYVAISQGGLVVWLDLGSEDFDGSHIVVRAVSWMTAATGVAALGVATDLAPRLGEEGLAALLAQRGFSAEERTLAELGAAVTLLTRVLLWPSLALCAVTLGASHAFGEVVARALRGLALVGYAPLAALLLAALARWSVALGTARPRLLLTALVGVPYLLAAATGTGTSVVHALGGLLDRVAAIAGGVG